MDIESKKNALTLSQLRILVTICDNDLNVTAAANQLNMPQPSLSKKLSALEGVIGRQLFYRNGKRFQYATDLCRQLTEQAREILLKCDNLMQLSEAEADAADVRGTLKIGTTHTQARYVLPRVLADFRGAYPNVAVNIWQGAPGELVRQLSNNQLDFAICTEALETNRNFRTIVSFSWNRCLLMRPDHPLRRTKKVTLPMLAKHPIVTYTAGFTGRGAFDAAFAAQGLTPNIAIAAADADVIKTYVRLGFGVGVIAQMAYEKERDSDLMMLPLGHLFPDMRVRLAYQSERLLTAAMQHFITLFTQNGR